MVFTKAGCLVGGDLLLTDVQRGEVVCAVRAGARCCDASQLVPWSVARAVWTSLKALRPATNGPRCWPGPPP